jgi:hypothetical protein
MDSRWSVMGWLVWTWRRAATAVGCTALIPRNTRQIRRARLESATASKASSAEAAGARVKGREAVREAVARASRSSPEVQADLRQQDPRRGGVSREPAAVVELDRQAFVAAA